MKFLFDEYGRDNIKYRLQNGIQDKLATTNKQTQAGRPKVVGRKTILDSFPNLSETKRAKLRAAIRERAAGEFGWRGLAERIQQILKLEKVPAHETAR